MVKNNDVHGSVINVENASSELLDVAYLYNRVIMDRITVLSHGKSGTESVGDVRQFGYFL
ncbi:hypothetical protein EHEC07001_13470 [Escherichia coli]